MHDSGHTHCSPPASQDSASLRGQPVPTHVAAVGGPEWSTGKPVPQLWARLSSDLSFPTWKAKRPCSTVCRTPGAPKGTVWSRAGQAAEVTPVVSASLGPVVYPQIQLPGSLLTLNQTLMPNNSICNSAGCTIRVPAGTPQPCL